MDAGIKDEETHTDLPLVPATGRALGLDRNTEQLASRAPRDVAPRGEVHLSKVGRGKGLQGLYEARRPLTSQQTRQPELQQAVRAHPDIVSARAGARAQRGHSCPATKNNGWIFGVGFFCRRQHLPTPASIRGDIHRGKRAASPFGRLPAAPWRATFVFGI